MELAIPRYGDGPEFSKVTARLRDKDELTIGRAYNNPILDKKMYEVEYKDGHKYFLAANAISENMFDHVNEEVNQHVIFQYIVDHRYNGTEIMVDPYYKGIPLPRIPNNRAPGRDSQLPQTVRAVSVNFVQQMFNFPQWPCVTVATRLAHLRRALAPYLLRTL